jgi:NADH:ubiquinone oxidoreductase subunit H
MAYNRQPNVVFAGTALKQNPSASTVTPPGIIPVTLDAEIATTTSLGVIQVGAGLSITPAGVLSAANSSGSINVTLTAVNYTATNSDYYIGATKKSITITLPLGTVGKVYIVKNQVEGSIKVKGTGQNLDDSGDKTLGSEASLIVVFDGTRWNII